MLAGIFEDHRSQVEQNPEMHPSIRLMALFKSQCIPNKVLAT